MYRKFWKIAQGYRDMYYISSRFMNLVQTHEFQLAIELSVSAQNSRYVIIY